MERHRLRISEPRLELRIHDVKHELSPEVLRSLLTKIRETEYTFRLHETPFDTVPPYRENQAERL